MRCFKLGRFFGVVIMKRLTLTDEQAAIIGRLVQDQYHIWRRRAEAAASSRVPEVRNNLERNKKLAGRANALSNLLDVLGAAEVVGKAVSL